MRRLSMVGIVLVCLSLSSCSGNKPIPIKDKVPVSKVKGVVTINGQPKPMIEVRCIPTGDIKEKRREFIGRFYSYTNEKGEFTMKTYALDDGLPAGDYAMLFKLLPATQAERDKEGDSDKLDNIYANLKSPFKTIKVEENAPLDVGTIDLKAPDIK